MNKHLAPYRFLALGRSDDGDRFLEIEVNLPEQSKIRYMSQRELVSSREKTINQLDAPLVTNAARNEFLDQAEDRFHTLKPTFHVATKPGWVRGVFALPDGTCVPPRNNLVVCLPQDCRAYADTFGCLGTLRGWRRIPELARGNTRLMLAVALSFACPVVYALELEAPMIQLFGAPGSGKSSIGAAAGSPWGGGSDGLFPQSWNHTVENVERVAVAFDATFLVLDETRVVDKSKERSREAALLYLIMRLALGQEKGRRTDFGAPLHFRSTLLSLSNKSLDEMGLAAREEIDDAYRGRLIDVPLPANCVGAFENLHDFENHAALSAEFLSVARTHHGVAAREFLKEFAEELRSDKASVLGWLKECREWYLKRVRSAVRSPNRDLERIHQKFATIYAAGALAIEYEILPWTRKELSNALVTCEQAHVDHVARFVSPTVSSSRQIRSVDPLERLRQHVLQNRSKFPDLRKGLIPRNTAHNHDSCPGYFNHGPDGSVELLFSNALLMQLCGGFNQVKRLKDQLAKREFLINESKRGVTRRAIWKNGGREGRLYVTAVREKAFENS